MNFEATKDQLTSLFTLLNQNPLFITRLCSHIFNFQRSNSETRFLFKDHVYLMSLFNFIVNFYWTQKITIVGLFLRKFEIFILFEE